VSVMVWESVTLATSMFIWTEAWTCSVEGVWDPSWMISCSCWTAASISSRVFVSDWVDASVATGDGKFSDEADLTIESSIPVTKCSISSRRCDIASSVSSRTSSIIETAAAEIESVVKDSAIRLRAIESVSPRSEFASAIDPTAGLESVRVNIHDFYDHDFGRVAAFCLRLRGNTLFCGCLFFEFVNLDRHTFADIQALCLSSGMSQHWIGLDL
jgi:hypothetical protein